MPCIGLVTGKKLPSYRTKAIAKKAEKAARKKGYRLITYDCRNCNGWHLAHRTHYRADCEAGCRCLKGIPKKEYKTKEDAIKTSSIISEKREIKMWVYECPKQEEVWHISSQSGATPKKKKRRKRSPAAIERRRRRREANRK
jgi:hypothetical protein